MTWDEALGFASDVLLIIREYATVTRCSLVCRKNAPHHKATKLQPSSCPGLAYDVDPFQASKTS
jgi:hypothetical protein